MIYICFLIWILYSIIDGVKDGIFYHFYNHSVKRLFNEHIIFVIQRLIVSVILCLLSSNLLLIIPLILSFSFFHNGSYYTFRNILNNNLYKKKWFAQSKTSTSFWTKFMTPVSRTILFLISVVILFIV